ncbi:hypothetical protein C0991_003045 [Blastosporella zonata]|nr:hypothetical protein C0991_003045 [Blastosporella zonata]
MAPSDAELATQALAEEGNFRFPSFSAADAVTLVSNVAPIRHSDDAHTDVLAQGLSLRKRFRGTSRHVKGKGLVISVQSIAGHTLFACTVGDLGHGSGIGDVSMDSWTCIEGMVSVVRRTGHSSFYVEKGMSAMGKTPKQMGLSQGELRVNGGAFPIWLENAPCCPIAVVACYSGSSQDDHNLVVSTIRDYLNKLARESGPPAPRMPIPMDANKEWFSDTLGPNEHNRRTDSPFEHREEHRD